MAPIRKAWLYESLLSPARSPTGLWGFMRYPSSACFPAHKRPDRATSTPVADVLAGIVGNRVVALGFAIVFLGVAIAHVWKAIQQKYDEHFDAPERFMKIIHPIAMVGLIARGAVLAVIAIRSRATGHSRQDYTGRLARPAPQQALTEKRLARRFVPKPMKRRSLS